MTYDFFKRWHRFLKLDWQIYSLYVLEQGPLGQRASEYGIKATPLPEDYLAEIMLYQVENGLSQEESTALSIGYSERLKHFMHPLSKIMDNESLKIFLLAQMAKGIPPEKVRKVSIKI